MMSTITTAAIASPMMMGSQLVKMVSVADPSDEVGEGMVPSYRLGRFFRDVAGRLNQQIARSADRVYLVLQPLGGDEVQFLKAGIIEVPDAFILNKCDEPSAERSYHHLRSTYRASGHFSL